jgi:molecular chaperone DnaK (HSP70)
METAILDSNITLMCCQSTSGSSLKIDSYNNECDEDMVQIITNNGSEENKEEIEKYENESSYDSSSSNFNNSEEFQYKESNICNESGDEKLRQTANKDFDRTAPFENYELSSINTEESFYQECESYSSHIYQECDNTVDPQFRMNSEQRKQLMESGTKIKLNAIIESLLKNYKDNIEFEFKNHITEIDSDFNKYHDNLSQEILGTFKVKIKYLERQAIVDKFYQEFEDILINRMKNCLIFYENEFKQTINNYEEVLTQSSTFFKKFMDLTLESHITGNFNTGLNGVQTIEKIFEECKQKTVNLFKSKSKNFFRISIEKIYLKKLDDMMMRDKIKYQNILSYFCNNQSRRKKKFPNQIYISKTDLKNFHEDEKEIILDPIKMLNQLKIHDYVDSLMKTVFTSFEEQNDIIGECELEMTLNAIDLSYELYRGYFETKLRSGLFTPTQVYCIHQKILTFVLKSLLESCDFNKDQKFLVDKCKTELKMKAENLYEYLLTEYQKKFDATVNLLNKIKTNAINMYCSEMNAKLSEPPPLNNNEFNDFHHEISRKAMELLNNSTEYFEQQFDEVFSKKLILETRSIIRNKINRKKVLFEKQNKENTAKGVTLAIYLGQQFITAAIYRNEILFIFDKFGHKMRPNSIEIQNGVFFGNEAQNSFSDTTSFISFDFKRLLGRKRKNVTNGELRSFPFNFVENRLSVHVTYDDLMLDMCIETILSLLILDLKSEAEKQIGDVVQNLVLTYPTNYSLIQKNAIRNATKIAGIEGDSKIISEISAAAIGYATDKCEIMSIETKYKVLFVVINDYECDVAVCEISRNEIKFKAYFNGKLDPNDLLNKKILSKITIAKLKSKMTKNTKKFKTKILFKYILEIVLKSAKYKNDGINDWIIAGNSQLIPNLMHWIQKHFCSKSSSVSNPVDIIINGCTIYGEMLAKRKEYIEIFEVATHDITFNFQTKFSPKRIFEVLKKNEPLSKEALFPYNIPNAYDLPINISIFQDRELVSIHTIDSIQKLYDRSEVWLKHDLLVNVDPFGDFELMSLITNKSKDLQIYLDFNVIKSGLSDVDIIAEKEKIFLLKQKINEKLNKVKQISLAENSANHLINFCLNAKTEVENNRDIRPMIKKEILKELEETLKFVETNRQDLVAINNRKQILIKELETYKFNTDLISSLLYEQ